MLPPFMFVFTCLQCALAGYLVGKGESYWILTTLSTSLFGAYCVWFDGRNSDNIIRMWRDIATHTKEAE